MVAPASYGQAHMLNPCAVLKRHDPSVLISVHKFIPVAGSPSVGNALGECTTPLFAPHESIGGPKLPSSLCTRFRPGKQYQPKVRLRSLMVSLPAVTCVTQRVDPVSAVTLDKSCGQVASH